jgi:2-polyprenyl-3-methyl-5-hydroxy-6-metoxy-1,4-benzoquinol methylase
MSNLLNWLVYKRFNSEHFENRHVQSLDPFETSSERAGKYKRTLEVLPQRRYRRALEAGCSIGIFTEMLAPLCDDLLAVDISEKAVVTARQRLASSPHVCIERRTLPEETPEGPFDLIVLSEVLYAMSKDVVLATLQRLEQVLAPGGALLVVEDRWNETTWRRRLVEKIRPLFLRHWILNNRLLVGGDAVYELLLEHTRLTNTVSRVEPPYPYRFDLFEDK